MYLGTFRRSAILCIAAAMSGAVGRAQNNVLSVGYTAPAFVVAPGQIVTLFTPPLNVPDAVADQTPLPLSLSGVGVAVRPVGPIRDSTGYPASLPILRVYSSSTCLDNPSAVPCPNTQITVEIPTEGVCEGPASQPCIKPFDAIPNMLVLNVSANGVLGADLPVALGTNAPHLLASCDSIFGPPGSDCHPLITHADGSLVSFTSPANVGETITIYAVGLNDRPFAPIYSKTGYPEEAPVAINPGLTQIILSYRLAPGPGAQFDPSRTYAPVDHLISPTWVGLTPGFVRLFQINATIPPMLPGTDSCKNAYGGNAYNASIRLLDQLSGTVYICVQP